MGRILLFTPSGVCYHCLNGWHKGCTGNCDCKKRKHNDSEWWVTEFNIVTTYQSGDVVAFKGSAYKCNPKKKSMGHIEITSIANLPTDQMYFDKVTR